MRIVFAVLLTIAVLNSQMSGGIAFDPIKSAEFGGCVWLWGTWFGAHSAKLRQQLYKQSIFLTFFHVKTSRNLLVINYPRS